MRAWGRPSVVLATVTWGSVLALGWAMAVGWLAPEGWPLTFMAFCFVVALVASASSTEDRGVVIEGRPIDGAEEEDHHG